MSAVTQILTHVADALGRLLTQYKGKPLLSGIISAHAQQIQDLENAAWSIYIGRDIFDAVGVQLDAIGGVVGLERQPGWSDQLYQVLLFAKVAVNNSNGTAEDIIATFKSMTQSTHVDYQNTFPRGVWLMGNAEIDPSLLVTLWEFLNEVVIAGVRIDAFGYYDATNAFTLAGDSTGAGLDDGTGTVGGMLAALYQPGVPVFALDGDNNNPNVAGLGDANDPVVGGQIQSA